MNEIERVAGDVAPGLGVRVRARKTRPRHVSIPQLDEVGYVRKGRRPPFGQERIVPCLGMASIPDLTGPLSAFASAGTAAAMRLYPWGAGQS